MLKTFFNQLNDKISPYHIIRDHLDTLVDGKGKRRTADYITFFVFPAIFAGLIKCLGAQLDYDMVSIINTGLALFAGLFLSVAIQLISIDKEKLHSDIAYRVRKQTVANISFLIFISLVTIVVSYFSMFKGIPSRYNLAPIEYFKCAIDCLTYWLLGVFMLTVLMVLKRTSILFEHISK